MHLNDLKSRAVFLNLLIKFGSLNLLKSFDWGYTMGFLLIRSDDYVNLHTKFATCLNNFHEYLTVIYFTKSHDSFTLWCPKQILVFPCFFEILICYGEEIIVHTILTLLVIDQIVCMSRFKSLYDICIQFSIWDFFHQLIQSISFYRISYLMIVLFGIPYNFGYNELTSEYFFCSVNIPPPLSCISNGLGHHKDDNPKNQIEIPINCSLNPQTVNH